MIKIKIEKNVPIPKDKVPHRTAEWPEEHVIKTLTSMDIGDSFVVPIKYRSWLYLCVKRHRYSNAKPDLRIKTTKESNETIRVFRVDYEND